MKVTNITRVGKKEVYDLSVKDVEHYTFENGVVSHNTGVMYSADTVFFIGKRQIKEGTEISGYDFIIKAEKSRMVKEKSQFPITVKFDGGIDPYSGLLEMAIDLGFVVKPKNGWYAREFLNESGDMVREEKTWRAKDTSQTDFWGPLFKHEPFRNAIKNRYQLGAIDSNAEINDEVEALINTRVSSTIKGVKFGEGVSAAEVEDQLDNFEDDGE